MKLKKNQKTKIQQLPNQNNKFMKLNQIAIKIQKKQCSKFSNNIN